MNLVIFLIGFAIGYIVGWLLGHNHAMKLAIKHYETRRARGRRCA